MDANRRSPNKLNPLFFAKFRSLVIQVVEDLHMIGDESQWLYDNVLQSLLGVELFDSIADVRFQPRLLWRS